MQPIYYLSLLRWYAIIRYESNVKVKDGKLSSSIEKVFPLADLKDALSRAKKESRDGKVLLQMNP